MIIVENLESYFFNQLRVQNHKLICPIPESLICYSSKVLVHYSNSSEFFDQKEGKNTQKILGEKILKASSLKGAKQAELYKEVADTSLVLCGYFSLSLKKRIVPSSYYESLGKMAYKSLDNLIPNELGIPQFYLSMATSFNHLVNILEEVSRQDESDPSKHLLLKVS